jgi:hypothetical protein
MYGKTKRWIGFSFASLIFPLLANMGAMRFSGMPMDLVKSVEKGEVFLIVVAMSTSAVIELVGSGSRWLFFKVIITVACVLVLFWSAMCSANISIAVLSQMPPDPNIPWDSEWTFIIGFLTGLVGVYLSESEA